MKSSLLALASATLSLFWLPVAYAHDLVSGEEHGHYDWSVKPPETVAPEWFLAQARTPTPHARPLAQIAGPVPAHRPLQAGIFGLFAPTVSVRWDENFLYVESNGLPAHNMMVGITNWQQQVPLPQNYTGSNAWRIPLSPVPATTPVSIKGHFLRGAIALAANGIPIFNPQNNRGEISAEIGELDQWGGHCGRADDYHYHAAPLHLQSVVGKDMPIAYALDGYPIYGLTEPDASQPTGLDALHGHVTPGLGYHYHASTKYPYVNGGFHGQVVEAEGQVDPQPSATPVRPALPPLQGAKITEFQTEGTNSRLTYEVSGEKRWIAYAVNADGTVPFEFQNGRAGTSTAIYTRRERRGGGSVGDTPPRDGKRPSRPGNDFGPGDRSGNPRPGNLPQTPASAGAPASSQVAPISKPRSSFVLTSSAVTNGGNLPVEYTGDGAGLTPPLEWKGEPAGTKAFALVMHHLDPEGKTKWYWIVYDIPANIHSLPKNAQGVGIVGTGFKGRVGYEPPRSRGPGAKTYVLTLYALSDLAEVPVPPGQVNYEVITKAINGKVLASADLSVVYTSKETNAAGAPADRPEPDRYRLIESPSSSVASGTAAALNTPEPASPAARRELGRNGGMEVGKPDKKALIKPTKADTVHVDVYADNWFAMFINGELVAVDSIKFTPHNVQSFDILPEYPMTIAIIAKDNADPKTGLEYGDHIGDGGLIVKFSDGTVSKASWKAKNFFKGPLNRETVSPKVEHTPIPDRWWAVDFDDSGWLAATEYTEERVNPKETFYQTDFSGAKFIWSDDLDLDNTVIFRTRIEKPGWKPRWNTHADLDLSGAPFR